LPQLYLLLKKQKADIYYCRMRDFRNILAFWAARKTKSKFILAMASDLDALGFRMSLKYSYLPYIGNIGGLWWIFNGLLNEIVHPWLLRKADLVLTQHEGQKNILQEKNIKSMVFLNIFDMTGLPVVSDPSHKDFIYVGELNKIKGFSDFFEIVKKAPFHSFKVVGQPQDRTGHLYYEKLKSYKNVYLLGRLSHSDTLWQIANSKALISTSPMEGFPNIFIEAWACGIPVFSLYVDPGSVIENEELGVVGHGNIDRLLSEMDNYRNTDEFTERAKTYVEHNHVLNTNRIKEINCLLS
jgi:glycosyltransferase involved in cell wall biosynthesis